MALLITEQDNTINIFDNFYSQSLVVNAAEWDNVNSYFLGVLRGDPGSVKTNKLHHNLQLYCLESHKKPVQTFKSLWITLEQT